ncbi:MAG: Lsr2 family protein [Dermatophilaceae bacterium]|nr:Lsr2 family protein [Dermatophilaceae bacterium]
MVQRVQYMLVDDLDGSEAVETVSFSLDGVSYEIDLTAANAKKLRNDLAAWLGHARRAGGRKSSRKAGASGGERRGDLSAVREWARKNGHQVSDRGRISAGVLAAYDKAHS